MRQRTWDTERAKRLFDEGADDIAIADAVGAAETAIKTWRARNHLKHPKTDEAPAVTEKRPGDERTSTPADPAVSGSVTEHRTMELPRKLRPTLVPVSLVPAVAMVMEYEAFDPEMAESDDPQKLRDSLYRHWLQYLRDPDSVADGSGFSHLWHVARCAAALIEKDGI